MGLCYWKGICSCPKLLNTHAIPCVKNPMNTLGSIKYIFKLAGYCIALLKPIRKPIPSLWYYIIKHHGFTLLEGYCSCPKLFNTNLVPLLRSLENKLGSITCLFKLGRVLHNRTKTYKECITLLGVFNKQYGLNIFHLNYQRGIVHA